VDFILNTFLVKYIGQCEQKNVYKLAEVICLKLKQSRQVLEILIINADHVTSLCHNP